MTQGPTFSPQAATNYDTKVELHLADNQDLFQIPTPGGHWSPHYEYPGFLAWVTNVPGCGSVELASGVGWSDEHVADLDLRHMSGDPHYALDALDFNGRFTGDIGRDAEIVRRAVADWMRANAKVITDACSAKAVPLPATGAPGRRKRIFAAFNNPAPAAAATLRKSLL